MKPTIGRIVHFLQGNKVVISGIIVKVWSETCVNLRLFPDSGHGGGNSEYSTSVTFDASETPASRTWNWPPKV